MASPSRTARGRALGGVLIGLSVLAAGCSGEEAVPIDPANPPTTAVDLTDVTHQIEPTEQMREAAEQQCLDDASLVQGYVRAVDPETEEILAELSVDCAEVRSDG